MGAIKNGPGVSTGPPPGPDFQTIVEPLGPARDGDFWVMTVFQGDFQFWIDTSAILRPKRENTPLGQGGGPAQGRARN